ncbi:CRISPR system precrRNA processing endoribonuclease RAMP protein Cas6 [candidate division KSB1 bacterium]|nr:CRISPR system precrRNA processing endoribonuclease RAMP protein Cas6 [candidate division KSB1 bacterium]
MRNLTLDSINMPSWNEALQSQEFSWVNLQFVYKAIDTLYLPPYKGSTLRGAFGNALKKLHCDSATCNGCANTDKCVYLYIFETPRALAANMEYHTDKAPHPFAIEPPATEQTQFAPHDEIAFDVTLFGEAVMHGQTFIEGFREAGKHGFGRSRGRCRLTHVYIYDNLLKTQKTEIYSAQAAGCNPAITTRRFAELVDVCQRFETSCIKVQCVTPMRIATDHKLQTELPFHLLVRSLLRRVSMLGQAHCNAQWDLPFNDILADAEHITIVNSNLQWYDWQRYSNRQGGPMKLGGLMGEIVYHGAIQPFMPLILLGSFVHAGKGTSFGLGKFDVSIQPY